MSLPTTTQTQFAEHLLFCKQKILQQIQHNYNCQIQQCLSIFKQQSNQGISPNVSCNEMIPSIMNEKLQMIQQLNNKYNDYITQFCKNEQIVLQFVATVRSNSNIAQKCNDTTGDCYHDKDTGTQSNNILGIESTTGFNSTNIKNINLGSTYEKLYQKVGNNGRMYKCRVCNKYESTRKETMVAHLRDNHSRKAKLVKYEYHLKKLDSIPNFKFHLLSNKKSKYNRRTKRSSTARAIKGYWKCKECHKILHTKRGALDHSRMHTGQSYQCIVCFKRFGASSDLKKHITIHTGEKPWQCQVCQKLFRLKSTYTNHVRCHTRERPYKCHYKRCNKRYKTSTLLKSHLLSHTKQKPFKCNVKGCNKAYQSRTGLKGHMNVHNPNGDRFVECHLCGKKLMKKSLRDHLVYMHKTFEHLPISCDICGKRVKNQWGLKSHKRQAHRIYVHLDPDTVQGQTSAK